MNIAINDIRAELIKNSDKHTKESGERFFKEEVRLLGVRSATVTRISREHFRNLHDKRKEKVFDICEKLFQTGYLEESFIACHWSYYLQKDYVSEDLNIFEKWISDYVSNWATCDTLCNHSVGTLIDMYPDKINDLKKWTSSENRWMRRAASVSLIVPAKKGKFLKDILEIAGNLMTDKDDMVQKGYGWMLKVASVPHLKEIFDFIILNKADIPRTAYRYAIEKMPADLRTRAMKK
jgi:3-methyladenine DNA glycosylase AlkD